MKRFTFLSGWNGVPLTFFPAPKIKKKSSGFAFYFLVHHSARFPFILICHIFSPLIQIPIGFITPPSLLYPSSPPQKNFKKRLARYQLWGEPARAHHRKTRCSKFLGIMLLFSLLIINFFELINWGISW